MNRIRLRKKYLLHVHLCKKNVIVVTCISFLICLIFLFKWINQKVYPLLLNYAETEATRLMTIVINKAVSKHLTEDLNVDDLFIVTKNDSGEIKTIDFNPSIVNKVLSLTTNTIHIHLKYIEQGSIDLLDLPDNALIDYDKELLKRGIIYEIPSGIIFENALLSNIGPKIPVRLSLVGDTVSNIKTNIQNYGINNALVEVFVNLQVRVNVILPFISKKVVVDSDIPIALKLIQGTIPNYYSNGISQNSPSFSIPLE